jgi:hypothetical protein
MQQKHGPSDKDKEVKDLFAELSTTHFHGTWKSFKPGSMMRAS